MYAVIETGGKQYKVEPGQIIEIELLEAQGGKVTFDRVLLASDGKDIKVGAPTIPNATVKGDSVTHRYYSLDSIPGQVTPGK